MDGPPLRAGVIGWPVKHSLSPAIHTAAAEAAGIDLHYTAIEVEPGRALAALDHMRNTDMRGYSVTMPHKEAVIPGLDELTPAAQALGAVNHITNTNGHLVGNNTDGDGFILGLESSLDCSVSGSTVAVFGTGGAARAIIEACYRHNADEVMVIGRSPDRAEAAARLAHDRGRVATVDALDDSDIVVNATPLGMDGTPGAGTLAFSVAGLREHAIVVDIVYNPRRTPVLLAAEERRLQTVGGVAMLVGQAAEQFTAWTGVAAPLDAMFAAVAEEGA